MNNEKTKRPDARSGNTATKTEKIVEINGKFFVEVDPPQIQQPNARSAPASQKETIAQLVRDNFFLQGRVRLLSELLFKRVCGNYRLSETDLPMLTNGPEDWEKRQLEEYINLGTQKYVEHAIRASPCLDEDGKAKMMKEMNISPQK